MSRHIDKEALVAAVMSSTELDNEQKSQLIRLIREQKKYGLVWEDSTEDAWEKMKTSIPVLNEVDDKRILNDKDGEHYPNHAIIEADNLHALIALTYTHAGMIDVIYIDPPYNTGNKDFVYNDSFIGEDDAYRHSKWLSFMEKRLQIAKTLLSEKGVIFISIDDNEQANLKLLCDEVFGSSNFIGSCSWLRKKKGSNLSKEFRKVTEYVCIYKKGITNIELYGEKAYAEKLVPLLNRPNNEAIVYFRKGTAHIGRDVKTNIIPKGLYGDGELTVELFNDLIIDRDIIINDFSIKGRFRWSQETIDYELKNGSVFYFSKTLRINVQRYNQGEKFKAMSSLIGIDDKIGTNEDATQELRTIFAEKDTLPFDFPKPTSLIKYVINSATAATKDSTILDFFAGSGTTLHATMQLNAEDGGHRQCILVTNNENNICEEVTYERNKRVIEGYTTPKGEQVAGLNHNNLRYYKLDFNPRKQSHQDNRELFYGLKDLLCIKENIYQEEQQFGSLSLEGKEQMLRYFAENGREMLMVYDTRVIPFIVNEIAQRGEQEQPLKIYIFADGAYPYADDFASVVDKVSLVPMPYAYYRGIKDSLPEETTTKVDDTELTNEEQQAMMAEAIAFESKE